MGDSGKVYVCRGHRGRWRLEYAGRKWLVFKSLDIYRGRDGWAVRKVLRKDWAPECWERA